MTNKELLKIAINAREKAYAPYSDFFVGAALLCDDGSVYVGCNIENASYTPTCCAERVALFKAVSEGKRGFKKIAIVGGKQGEVTELCYPCGVCRQVLSEFCADTLEIIVGTEGDISVTTLGELLPNAFRINDRKE